MTMRTRMSHARALLAAVALVATAPGGGWTAVSAAGAPGQFRLDLRIGVAPPPPRIETPPPPPSPEHYWIPGHWQWENGQHVWVDGHWEEHRRGYVWVPAHWIRIGPTWQFVGRHWQPV